MFLTRPVFVSGLFVPPLEQQARLQARRCGDVCWPWHREARLATQPLLHPRRLQPPLLRAARRRHEATPPRDHAPRARGRRRRRRRRHRRRRPERPEGGRMREGFERALRDRRGRRQIGGWASLMERRECCALSRLGLARRQRRSRRDRRAAAAAAAAKELGRAPVSDLLVPVRTARQWTERPRAAARV
jgi:hypothetical protein